jgi:hypothetical protein
MQNESLIEKIKSLPPDQVSMVEAFVDFIAQRDSAADRHEAIAAYAAEYGGSIADLDPKFEEASLEHLRDEEEVNR